MKIPACKTILVTLNMARFAVSISKIKIKFVKKKKPILI